MVIGAVGIDRIDLQFAVGAVQNVVDENDFLTVRMPTTVEMRQRIFTEQRLPLAARGVHGP